MEQYEIAPKIFLETVKCALSLRKPEYIFIRQVGSAGGKTIVSIELRNKNLSLQKTRGGIKIIVNKKEIFFWRTSRSLLSGKQWSIAYERWDENNRLHHAVTGYENPDDNALPRIVKTFLRAVSSDRHYGEIRFNGKISIIVDEKNTNRNENVAYWKWKLKK
ncbi:MAG: hypothetical protein KGJ89_00540 [Patescibacteria group bacterium]|nr:hypothetical protein [Patescibacteria group bacterium]MDE2015003.1 hypothetical protein [Patescibacteria group bacterium]MDE2226431.1 hypothetical protein [Patescibacteria group bacterium]